MENSTPIRMDESHEMGKGDLSVDQVEDIENGAIHQQRIIVTAEDVGNSAILRLFWVL